MHAKQLVLPLVPTSLKRFEWFYPGQNHLCVTTLKQEPLPQFIYIYGSSGSGKTHLLEAYAYKAIEAKKRVLYVPLKQIQLHRDFFRDLQKMDALLLDDLEYLNPALATALFHGFNSLQQQQIPLIITSQLKPSALNLALPDLKSRLQSGLSFNLIPLMDEELKTALTLYAQQLELKLDDKIYSWLLTYQKRDLHVLTKQLQAIANYSLAAKKPITLPLVKQALLTELY